MLKLMSESLFIFLGVKRPSYKSQFYGGLCFGLFAVFFFVTAWDMLNKGIYRDEIIILLAVFLVATICFAVSSAKSIKADTELMANSIKIEAKLTEVKRLYGIKHRSYHPFVASYTYKSEGNSYTGKSNLLWEEPKAKKDGTVYIFVNKDNVSQSIMN